MEYRPELDGIRAIAVVAVVAFHASVLIGLLGGGWLGVDVFFVLSGYLITAILLREREGTGRVDLRAFWVRRLLRLYPALLLVLALGAFWYRLLGDDGTVLGYLRTAAASGFYVENVVWGLGGDALGGFGHTWSLAVEMQFYLVWPPVLVWLLARRPHDLGRWVLGAAVVSYALLVLQSGPEVDRFPIGYYVPWTRAFELLLGAMVALHLGRPDRTPSTPRRWHGWALLAGFGAVFLLAATYSILTSAHVLAWEAPLAAVLTAFLLAHLDGVRTTGVGALLAWSPLVRIGKVSYGIYLVHYPVLAVLRDHGFGEEHASALFVLGLAISWVIAEASYRLVERPALRLKDSLQPR